VIISKDNYCRLTVPPMIWVGFQGLSNDGSMLLNIASIEHDPTEHEKKNIEQIEFDWNK
jgi:dTDP-4-dehydrorhamnose 3,5-epimerase